MKKKFRILLDMDGVLCHFAEQYKKINGVSPNEVYVPGQPATCWNRFVDQHGFEDIPVLPDALNLLTGVLRTVQNSNFTIEICTSAGGKARYDDVKPQKLLWLKNHGFGDFVAHITQNGYRKADVIDLEKYNDILIDDTPVVVENFIKHGGFAILHTSATDTIEKLETLVHELSGD
jgi:hypothetical protein